MQAFCSTRLSMDTLKPGSPLISSNPAFCLILSVSAAISHSYQYTQRYSITSLPFYALLASSLQLISATKRPNLRKTIRWIRTVWLTIRLGVSSRDFQNFLFLSNFSQDYPSCVQPEEKRKTIRVRSGSIKKWAASLPNARAAMARFVILCANCLATI
jgi:hypothetical protein